MSTVTTFPEWLEQQITQRGWTQSELARRVNMTSAAINHIVHGNRNPGVDFLLSLARALKLPPEEVFRKAGIFPPKPEEPPGLGEWIQRYLDASEEQRQEMLEYARFKTRRKNNTSPEFP